MRNIADDELLADLEDMIGSGVIPKVAGRALGITKGQWKTWMNLGREQYEDDDDTAHAHFYEIVMTTPAKYIAARSKSIFGSLDGEDMGTGRGAKAFFDLAAKLCPEGYDAHYEENKQELKNMSIPEIIVQIMPMLKDIRVLAEIIRNDKSGEIKDVLKEAVNITPLLENESNFNARTD